MGKYATDAICADGEQVGKVHLREVTLAQHALLDKIQSPFCDMKRMSNLRNQPLTTADALPTLFVLSRPAIECHRLLAAGTFDEAVIEWADTIGTGQIPALVEGLVKIFGRISAIIPQGVPDEDEKKTEAATGGTSPSRHSRRKRSAGSGTTS